MDSFSYHRLRCESHVIRGKMLRNGRKRKTSKTGQKRPGGSTTNACNGLVAACDNNVLQNNLDHLRTRKITSYFPGVVIDHDHPYANFVKLSNQPLQLPQTKGSFLSCCPPVIQEQTHKDGEGLVLVEDRSNVKQTVPKLKTVIKPAKDVGNQDVKKGQSKTTSRKGTTKVVQSNIIKEKPNRTLTDYFPVRRSNRKTSFTIKKEKQDELEEAILSGRENGFEVKNIVGKGRGVFATKNIKRGEFVLEYHGELIDMHEAKIREAMYAADENIGCYMYYFVYKNKQYCVDATKDTGRLGRLVNHSINGNLKTIPFPVKDVPRLILVAKRDIEAGEELLYDYGDRSKSSLECHPWLAT